MEKITLLKNKAWIGFEINSLGSCDYFFFTDEKNNLARKVLGKGVPETISTNSELGRLIKKHINLDGRSSKQAQEEDLIKVLNKLQNIYNNTVQRRKESIDLEAAEVEQERNEKIRGARLLFDNIQNPLHYISCLTDWFCADERMNTTLSFVIYASQIVLNNPISLVSIGEAGSGKSHIFKTALSMIPSEYVLKDKRPTFAAMINRANEDKEYYDGKIVFLGDMGGEEDKSEAMDCLNILKELQTDGEFSNTKNVQKGKEWFPETFTLIGRPCLSYTTVPNYQFDNQELSRMIQIKPKTFENLETFKVMKKSLEMKGKSFRKQQEMENVVKFVPYLLLSLKEEFKDVEVINPYLNVLNKFLEKSEYFKRDEQKYDDLLKIVTVLNGFNRPKIELDGRKYLLVTKNDVHIFQQLISDYLDNISLNLSKNAVEVLNVFEEFLVDDIEGTTLNEFVETELISKTKGSIGNAFSELNREGYIKVVKKEGNTNRYVLSQKDRFRSKFENIELTEEDKKIILYEQGEEVLNLIINEDTYLLDLSSQHDEVEKPPWEMIV